MLRAAKGATGDDASAHCPMSTQLRTDGVYLLSAGWQWPARAITNWKPRQSPHIASPPRQSLDNLARRDMLITQTTRWTNANAIHDSRHHRLHRVVAGQDGCSSNCKRQVHTGRLPVRHCRCTFLRLRHNLSHMWKARHTTLSPSKQRLLPIACFRFFVFLLFIFLLLLLLHHSTASSTSRPVFSRSVENLSSEQPQTAIDQGHLPETGTSLPFSASYLVYIRRVKSSLQLHSTSLHPPFHTHTRLALLYFARGLLLIALIVINMPPQSRFRGKPKYQPLDLTQQSTATASSSGTTQAGSSTARTGASGSHQPTSSSSTLNTGTYNQPMQLFQHGASSQTSYSHALTQNLPAETAATVASYPRNYSSGMFLGQSHFYLHLGIFAYPISS